MRVLVKFDIKRIQYMNAFERITKVKAKACFNYNTTVVFVVPKPLMTKTIGKEAENVKKLAMKIGHKVKIVAAPTSKADIETFIRAIVFPHKIKGISLENNKLTIHISPKIKALIIGKGKTRLRELAEVLNRFFRIREVQVR